MKQRYKKEFVEKDLWGFAFWRGKNPSLQIDGRGFVGKGSIVFWGGGGEAGKGCTLRKKAWLLPHVVKDSHIYMSVFGGRKLKSFPRWGRIRGERYRLTMHLEVKRNVNLIPCGEGFTWKDSYALKVEESLTPSTYRERFVGEIALHLRILR